MNTPGGASPKYSGFLAGGGGGYNYQLDSLVVGGQVEWDWANARGGDSFSCRNSVFRGFVNNSLSSFGCETRVNSILTATTRIGYALDRLLVYGQFGLAAGDGVATAKTTVDAFPGIGPGDIVASQTINSASKMAVGWTIGAGFEFGLTKNISAKAEYLYFDLGSDSYNLGVPVAIERTGNIESG